MDAAVGALKRHRRNILVLNLFYFLLLLATGALIFLVGVGGVFYLLAGACVVLYIFLVRPATRRYVSKLREEILRSTLGQHLEDWQYDPKDGVSSQQVQASGLISTTSPRSFYSREHISGRAGSIQIELADVTFPIWERARNAMFSGCFLRLRWPGMQFPSLMVRAGDTSALQLPGRQMELLEEMGSLIPGSLYLKMEGDSVNVLLRGRFLGFSINPLAAVTQSLLETDPLPEMGELIQLARLAARKAAEEPVSSTNYEEKGDRETI